MGMRSRLGVDKDPILCYSKSIIKERAVLDVRNYRIYRVGLLGIQVCDHNDWLGILPDLGKHYMGAMDGDVLLKLGVDKIPIPCYIINIIRKRGQDENSD